MATGNLAFYCALLLAVLSLPWAQRLLPDPGPEQWLRTAHRGYNFPYYLHRQVFEETAPIDVALFGPSGMRADVSPRLLAKLIARPGGAPPRVVQLPFSAPGIELQWYVVRELLKRRPVKLLLFTTFDQRRPNYSLGSLTYLPHWEGFVAALPWSLRLPFYGCALLSTPRLLFAWLTAGSTQPIAADPFHYAEHDGGSVFGDAPELSPTDAGVVQAAAAALPPGAAAHRAGDADLDGDGTDSPLVNTAVRLIAEEAAAHGAQIAYVTLPLRGEHGGHAVVPSGLKPLLAQRQVPVVALAPDAFRALPLAGRDGELFYDDFHLNARGGEIFTRGIAAAVAAAFARAEAR